MGKRESRKKRPARSAPVGHRPLSNTLLQLIWREQQISRAEIARKAELSRSTVSEIVSAFLPTGLIEEVGAGPSSGGRRPIVLQFRDDAFSILGVEMGAAHVAVALTDLRGHILTYEQRDHPVRDDPHGTRALVRELSEHCLAAADPGSRHLAGIGVAVPSPVDPSRPGWLSEVVLPRWGGRLGLEELSRQFEAPILMDNDANLGALAEHWWGSGQGIDNFIYVKVGTGIGSGHVMGGEIYRGATGVAGEIGHMSIDPHGKPCICGLRGCLATLVGARALEERAAELLDRYPKSALAGNRPTITAIEDAALAGDILALEVAHEAAEHLGVAVANMLNLLNPTMVILGGGLARLGELLLEPLRETVRSKTLVSSLAASEIRTSTLGPRTIATGAATLVLKSALDDWRRFPIPLSSVKT